MLLKNTRHPKLIFYIIQPVLNVQHFKNISIVKTPAFIYKHMKKAQGRVQQDNISICWSSREIITPPSIISLTSCPSINPCSKEKVVKKSRAEPFQQHSFESMLEPKILIVYT